MSRRSAPRPSLLRSIRTRLALTFFLVTVLSVAVIYVVVAPPLTSGLEQQRVHNIENTLRIAHVYSRVNGRHGFYQRIGALAFDVPSKKGQKSPVAAKAADYAQALSDLTLYQVNIVDIHLVPTGAAPQLAIPLAAYPSTQSSATIVDDFAPTATASTLARGSPPPKEAYQNGLAMVGINVAPPSQQQQFARIVVFSERLSDVGPIVALVRSRILLAAILGLVVALLTGALVARAITSRVLRLERTAERVAQGDFGAQFSDSTRDELGQLASSLANMQSQLEDLDNARRRFIATASHELRTPIFSLGGFLELLEDENLDGETREQFLGQVREQVARLGKLATQLLDLTRLESGSIELAPSITDLGVLARAVGGEFAPALAQHDSRLDLRLPMDPVRVLCDSERVAQVLRILIDNAIAHTPAGTRVMVRARPAVNGTGPQLAVRDSGPGIPQDAMARVFEPFYSADGAHGAGLGLAIARELAMRMNATLEIDSDGAGTTFTLTLPALEV